MFGSADELLGNGDANPVHDKIDTRKNDEVTNGSPTGNGHGPGHMNGGGDASEVSPPGAGEEAHTAAAINETRGVEVSPAIPSITPAPSSDNNAANTTSEVQTQVLEEENHLRRQVKMLEIINVNKRKLVRKINLY